MANFLTSNDLNAELENLFESAEDYLILISPYIKLHERYLSALKAKMNNPQLEIIIVFGKNEDDLSKSTRQADFSFFGGFPNIEIRYEKRLHAKYYANETFAILTSMNLYNYSQDNNIEFGVLTSRKGAFRNFTGNLLSNISEKDDLEYDAGLCFDRVIEQSEILFKRVPQYESKMLGLTKRYLNSVTEIDKLSAFFNKTYQDTSFKKENIIASPKLKTIGYCIRKGVEIPFDPKKPMCDAAFEEWKKFSNGNYPEKFCHFSGEKSNGETTFSKPILT